MKNSGVDSRHLLSGRTLDPELYGSSANMKLSQGADLWGPLRYCSLPKVRVLWMFSKSLSLLEEDFWLKRIQEQSFLSTLSPPLAAGFLSHISPPTLFLLLSPRLKLVGELLPEFQQETQLATRCLTFFTPLRLAIFPVNFRPFPPSR